jgi:hypothetical protein
MRAVAGITACVMVLAVSPSAAVAAEMRGVTA